MPQTKLTELAERDLQELVLTKLYASIAENLLPRAKGAEKLRLGSFELDFAVGTKSGGFAIVEFKVNAHHGTFGQLLLYPRAVQQVVGPEVPISVVLITTHLDMGVVELMERVRVNGWAFRALLATGTIEAPRLVSPSSECSDQVFWDRAEATGEQGARLRGLLA